MISFPFPFFFTRSANRAILRLLFDCPVLLYVQCMYINSIIKRGMRKSGRGAQSTTQFRPLHNVTREEAWMLRLSPCRTDWEEPSSFRVSHTVTLDKLTRRLVSRSVHPVDDSGAISHWLSSLPPLSPCSTVDGSYNKIQMLSSPGRLDGKVLVSLISLRAA